MPVVLIDKNFDPPHAIARFRLKSQATNFLKLLQQQDHANLFRYGLTSPAPSQAEPEQ
ncbi:hypothetical protein [Almyronema epifaneia]|uniref:Uncharacterized protein n=1 Tax=Almyronema epifaneia S1 TaxID=2991925 RepID=A0ABW6IDQ7_9CYAN